MKRSATKRSATRSPAAVLFVISAFGAAACEGAGGSEAAVMRADSAGIELVTSPAEDRAAPWSYEEAFALGGENEGPASFYRVSPRVVATDGLNRIHVLHGAEHRIATFEGDGSFVRTVGRQGGGPGEFEMAGSMSANGAGDVVVFDYGKMALVRWDSAGELLPQRQFPHPPSWSGRHHVLSGDGYLVSTGGMVDDERVQRLIVVAGEDTTTLAVSPQPNRGMVMFEDCGGGVSFPPLFTPGVVWDHRDGTTAVASGDEYRVDLWRGGRIIRSIRRPLPVTQATRELAIAEAGEGFTIDFGRGPCTVPPDEYAEARGWAETVPAINQIALGPDAGLWVQRRVPGEDHPPIDRFDPEGAYLGTLPAGTPFPALLLEDGSVAVVATDEFDVQRLVVSRPGAGAPG